jgi:hypothetical protein
MSAASSSQVEADTWEVDRIGTGELLDEPFRVQIADLAQQAAPFELFQAPFAHRLQQPVPSLAPSVADALHQ